MSGSETISARGMPARLKSTRECVEPASESAPWCSILAESSSMCSRVMATVLPPGSSRDPRAPSGVAYCVIW